MTTSFSDRQTNRSLPFDWLLSFFQYLFFISHANKICIIFICLFIIFNSNQSSLFIVSIKVIWVGVWYARCTIDIQFLIENWIYFHDMQFWYCMIAWYYYFSATEFLMLIPIRRPTAVRGMVYRNIKILNVYSHHQNHVGMWIYDSPKWQLICL